MSFGTIMAIFFGAASGADKDGNAAQRAADQWVRESTYVLGAVLVLIAIVSIAFWLFS